ncbi:MAG: hypothetical protein ACW981_11275 [Candidatus Hodarchaeales archaeon]|jgi:hypothetical protein
MKNINDQNSKLEKKINTQIKITEDLHNEFKEFADQRAMSIQGAGVEALEFWIAIQQEIGTHFSSNDPKQLKKDITKAFKELISSWSKKKQKEAFKEDSFLNIIGMTSGDENLSKKHDRHYTRSES